MTAWLAPLPPKPTVNPVPVIVSPGLGKRSAKVVISVLQLPTTTTSTMLQPECVVAVLQECSHCKVELCYCCCCHYYCCYCCCCCCCSAKVYGELPHTLSNGREFSAHTHTLLITAVVQCESETYSQHTTSVAQLFSGALQGVFHVPKVSPSGFLYCK
jgi:hypothetical protein